MVNKSYRCGICNTQFDSQLSHHKSHLKTQKHLRNVEIKMANLRVSGLEENDVNGIIQNLQTITNDSQHCFINNKKIYITDYIENISLYDNKQLLDVDGNELIFCYGQKVKPYFRHSNTNPTPMTEWHKEWQSHFSDYVEKPFPKKNEGQIKSRRSDVDLNDQCIIEFQHSYISLEEVINRKNDYMNYSKEIIWIIHGDNIDVEILNNSHRVLMDFTNNTWKYKSFLTFNNIYIDIQKQIYKINPTEVRSHMINLSLPVPKDTFIYSLKSGENPFDDSIDIYQTQLYVKQMGAGNGKTFNVVQLIQDSSFEYYNTYVYLTKQHSAKHIILSEIKDQLLKGHLNNVEFDKNSLNLILKNQINKNDERKSLLTNIIMESTPSQDDDTIKQYNLTYKTKDSTEKRIIIGTFDSFVFSLANKNCKGVDKFLAMVRNIIISEEIRCAENGSIQYTQSGIKLNKKLLLIGDEMQDLHSDYMKAILKIMLDRYVDFYAVGDKLQSICVENNAFTFLQQELPPQIDVNKFEALNICRRFGHPKLIDFVNNIVPFKKFNLPSIQSHKQDEVLDIVDPLKIFKGEKISYNNDFIINNEVNQIMKHYMFEVEKCGRQPHDFLIVTLFVKTNPLVEALHIAIREYWQSKNTDKHNYSKYSFFHKSSEGTSIDLSESDTLTRIVSDHASKGDGRKVVFVLGFTEKGLKKFSGETGNLIYESLLHVALTRMKEKLYFRVEENKDDIHRRIDKYCKDNNINTLKPLLQISKNISITELKTNKDFDICYDTIIKSSKYSDDNLSILENDKKIIDMKHHNIRYATMIILSILHIVEYEQQIQKFRIDTHRGQFYILLQNVINFSIVPCDTTSEYNRLLIDKKNDKTIPIYKYKSKGGDYILYFKKIRKWIDEIRQFLKRFLEGDASINELDYKQCIVLYFLIEISSSRLYSKMTISDLYDIVDIMLKLNKNENEVYIQNHYKKINAINKLWSKIHEKYPDLNFLYQHYIQLQGDTNHFGIYKNITFLAYDKSTVIIFVLKPQFGMLNYNEIIFNSLYDTFLVKNVKHFDKSEEEISNNYNRFHGKQIQTVVMTPDLTEPFSILWNQNNIDLIEHNDILFKNILKDNSTTHFKLLNNHVWYFYKYWRNETKHMKSISSITEILQKYEEERESKENRRISYPTYIHRCLSNIEYEVRNSLSKKITIEKYDEEKVFKNLLETLLTEEIERYFGMYVDDEE